VNWLAACNHSSRMFPCFHVRPRSRLVRARQREQRRQITAAKAASGAVNDGPSSLAMFTALWAHLRVPRRRNLVAIGATAAARAAAVFN